jgi:hypothetical protein
MSKITKGGILIFVIAVAAIATVYWFFGTRWFGVDVSPARNYSSSPEPPRLWSTRKEADMIIAGTFTPTIYELNSIITTLACFGEDHDPDKLRVQQLRQIRNHLENSHIPRDTTPNKP